jgi:hypothetical protein
MRDDHEDALGVIGNTKVESIIPIDAPLPHIIDAAVFLGVQRGMAKILRQILELLVYLPPKLPRQATVVLVRATCQFDPHGTTTG